MNKIKKFMTSVMACITLFVCIAGNRTQLFSRVLAQEEQSDSVAESVENEKLEEVDTSRGYYYSQLATGEAMGIYRALEKMKEENLFKTGVDTLDLVKEKFLKNEEYDQGRLTFDFAAAKDAFSLDYAELFYVDFSKLSLRQLKNGEKYRITVGIGRENNYFADGFSAENVDEAITEFESSVEEIVGEANKKGGRLAQIESVYRQVMERASYALEADATPENVPFVRNAYGALVKGQTVCEGFSRAVKTALDRLHIPTVLVQGGYLKEGEPRLHMWNYVQMEDRRWYLLDATMDNGINETGTARAHFLKSGVWEGIVNYQEDGQISLYSQAFTFAYPQLSGREYEEGNYLFTAIEQDGKNYISYGGRGLESAKTVGKYILFSYDVSLTGRWYYVDLHYAAMCVAMGQQIPELSTIDSESSFENYNGENGVVYAVTEIPPAITYEEINTFENAAFTGTNSDIFDVSLPFGSMFDLGKIAPCAVKKEPTTSRLEEGKTYDVKITFSEALKKSNLAVAPSVALSVAVDGAKVEEVEWKEEKPKELTFKLTTAKSYRFNTPYYVQVEGLVGEKSLLTPQEVCFNVVNNPVFACPKIEGAFHTVYANVPTLLSERELTYEGWVDKEGNPVSENLPSKFTLLASTPDAQTCAEMKTATETAIGESPYLLSYYDLQLGLCDTQIAYCGGDKMKVLVPYPDGLEKLSANEILFKAYHFDTEGKPEEIDCIATSAGLILYCEAFSPFSVAAIKGKEEQKQAYVHVVGAGLVNYQRITIEKGENITLRFFPKEGYVLDKITLNGKRASVTDGAIRLGYYEFNDVRNVIEVTFAAESVVARENAEGFTPVLEQPETVQGKKIKIRKYLVWAGVAAVGCVIVFFFVRRKEDRR